MYKKESKPNINAIDDPFPNQGSSSHHQNLDHNQKNILIQKLSTQAIQLNEKIERLEENVDMLSSCVDLSLEQRDSLQKQLVEKIQELKKEKKRVAILENGFENVSSKIEHLTNIVMAAIAFRDNVEGHPIPGKFFFDHLKLLLKDYEERQK